MDVAAYLSRLGYDGPTAPNIANLRAMHRAHFYSVPFENLDISMGRTIEVDEAVNFEKVVRRRRGGFCLELTGLFARALRELGYQVDVLGGRVFQPDGNLSEPLSHMTLLVHLEEPWIVDVGFGGRVAQPLRLVEPAAQVAEGRRHTVANDGDHWFVTVGEPGGERGCYTFTLKPREFDEFHEVCTWLQTSSESRFTSGPIVSLATERGRKTLAGDKLILTDGGQRSELNVASQAHRAAVLLEHFGISL